MTKTTTMHLHLEDPETNQDVLDALRAGDIAVKELREVTEIQDGYSLTESLMRGIWEHETGQAECSDRNPDKCPHNPPHRGWEELEGAQRSTFLNNYVRFMENSRADCLLPILLLGDEEQFEGTALERSR